jgi:hypothetical protein
MAGIVGIVASPLALAFGITTGAGARGRSNHGNLLEWIAALFWGRISSQWTYRALMTSLVPIVMKYGTASLCTSYVLPAP